MASCPEITLNNGMKIPAIGLGTGTVRTETERQTGVETIKKAVLNHGYRHIDTASLYGSEPFIGQALSEIFATGQVKREEMWITTKLFVTERHEVETALRRSLANLQINYVDLYLVHWPVPCLEPVDLPKSDPLHVTWKAMEDCVDLGLTRAIGLSNHHRELTLDLLTYCRIKPVINQLERNPYINQKGLVDYMHGLDIKVCAFSPVGSPDQAVINPAWADVPLLLTNPLLNELATKYGKSAAQIALNWNLHLGGVVLCFAVDEQYMRENIEAGSFEMSAEDYAEIDKLNRNLRVYDQSESTSIRFHEFGDRRENN